LRFGLWCLTPLKTILLMEETGVPGENHQPVASRWQTLTHKVVSTTPRHERDSNLQQ
jgi:hypothetical protein